METQDNTGQSHAKNPKYIGKIPILIGKAASLMRKIPEKRQKNDRFSTKIYFIVSSLLTIMFILVGVILPITVSATELSAYGSYVSGLSTAIALCWLVSGYWLQRAELNSLHNQFLLQQEAYTEGRRAHLQTVTMSFLPSFYARLDQIAYSIYISLYTDADRRFSVDGWAEKQYEESYWISLLLKQADFEERLLHNYESGFPLALTVASSFVREYDSLKSTFSMPTFDEEIAKIVVRSIESHKSAALRRRIFAVLGSTPIGDPNDGKSYR